MASVGGTLAQTASFLRFGMRAGGNDDGLAAFASVRRRLFGIAYHMLGSAAEAEDIVQDAWLQWQSANRSVVENPPAFLATTTTRLCINLAKSAHSRRETYIGTWLPEPVGPSDDPGSGVERSEALRLAFLLLLEKLSPTERAAYVLREAFEYSYHQIADILQMEEANVRQVVSRARKHLADGRSTPVSAREQRRLLAAFIAAAQKGNMAALEDLFAKDVASCRNGGGVVHGARHRSDHADDESEQTRCDFEVRPGVNERRRHSREGILGCLGNATYSVLRKYGIPATQDVVMGATPPETVVGTNDSHTQGTDSGIPSVSCRSRRTASSEWRARSCRPIW